MPTKTKAHLEIELAQARELITGLRAEVTALYGGGTDAVEGKSWALLRTRLDKYVGAVASRDQLVQAAADIVKSWDALPGDTDAVVDTLMDYGIHDGDALDRDALLSALDLWASWKAYDLEHLEAELRRAGVLKHGRTMWEALGVLVGGR